MGTQLNLFTKLYDEHSVAIYRFLFLRVRSKEVAEDLAQEVFLRILPRVKDGSLVETTALPYLYTIARNALIDHFRKKKSILFEESDDIYLTPAEERNDTSADGFALLGEDKALIARALDALGEDARAVITLHYMEELAFDEIAAAINKTEEAVRQIKSRALKKLREYIDEHESEYRTT